MLIPQNMFTVSGDTYTATTGLNSLYIGGTGLFVAILVGRLSAFMYVKLSARGLGIKMPDSVPANVKESLSPSIISLIILTTFFIVRVGFSFTPFSNAFTIIFSLLHSPLQSFTSSNIAMIFVFTLANVMCFFGVHPNVIYGLILPIFTANIGANAAAFINGEALPFFAVSFMYQTIGQGFGGQGGIIGFAISSFTAKSKRYKQL